ncbi:hypothetical protein [Helicobacter felis]|nr:hypothetical protein [Helicobacter felis]
MAVKRRPQKYNFNSTKNPKINPPNLSGISLTSQRKAEDDK